MVCVLDEGARVEAENLIQESFPADLLDTLKNVAASQFGVYERLLLRIDGLRERCTADPHFAKKLVDLIALEGCHFDAHGATQFFTDVVYKAEFNGNTICSAESEHTEGVGATDSPAVAVSTGLISSS